MIRPAQMEELAQEIVDVFLKKVVAYKDKRLEIVWNFSERSQPASGDVADGAAGGGGRRSGNFWEKGIPIK